MTSMGDWEDASMDARYTPTLVDVRNAYIGMLRNPVGDVDASIGGEFDRLVASHDAGIREECADIAESMSKSESDGYYVQACYDIAAAIRGEQP